MLGTGLFYFKYVAVNVKPRFGGNLKKKWVFDFFAFEESKKSITIEIEIIGQLKNVLMLKGFALIKNEEKKRDNVII